MTRYSPRHPCRFNISINSCILISICSCWIHTIILLLFFRTTRLKEKVIYYHLCLIHVYWNFCCLWWEYIPLSF
jgi:hypothetical protein